jgi:uncharacterized membrane protein YphA (DoxX/SURF4 family)
MAAGMLSRRIDTGLLLLRVGVGISCVLLFALKQSEGANIFLYHPGRLWPLVALALGTTMVTFGFLTRPVACALAVSWLWALYSGLHLGQAEFSEPMRSALFSISLFTLFLSGPGRFSIDAATRRRETRAQAPE